MCIQGVSGIVTTLFELVVFNLMGDSNHIQLSLFLCYVQLGNISRKWPNTTKWSHYICVLVIQWTKLEQKKNHSICRVHNRNQLPLLIFWCLLRLRQYNYCILHQTRDKNMFHVLILSEKVHHKFLCISF